MGRFTLRDEGRTIAIGKVNLGFFVGSQLIFQVVKFVE